MDDITNLQEYLNNKFEALYPKLGNLFFKLDLEEMEIISNLVKKHLQNDFTSTHLLKIFDQDLDKVKPYIASQIEDKCKYLIYICSPLRGFKSSTMRDNINYVKEICNILIYKGYTPFAPHLYFTQFLDDRVPEERDMGIFHGKNMIKVCQEVWVFPKAGVISQGMKDEIQHAKDLNKKILYFKDMRGNAIEEVVELEPINN